MGPYRPALLTGPTGAFAAEQHHVAAPTGRADVDLRRDPGIRCDERTSTGPVDVALFRCRNADARLREDVDGDGRLDLDAESTPAEPYGVGQPSCS